MAARNLEEKMDEKSNNEHIWINLVEIKLPLFYANFLLLTIHEKCPCKLFWLHAPSMHNFARHRRFHFKQEQSSKCIPPKVTAATSKPNGQS